jgi:ATP-dependent Clp protease ATP-binding subunit ClpA
MLWVVFEQFTERARQVVVLAHEEARELRHNYIGTEHLLLGLLREQEGLAPRVLESLEITVERVRAEIKRIVGSGEEVTSGQIPFTPRSKKVLELALREAKSLGNNYIGTEHILLGMLRENDGVAVRILRDLNADPDTIRNEVIEMLSGPGALAWAHVVPEGSRVQSQRIAPGWLDGLGLVLNQLADEIRRELGREPDAGDLLLVLTAAHETLAAQALARLGVDVDELWGQLERLRSEARSARETLGREIEQVRIEKERALESQQFDAAARYRDRERELTEQRRGQTIVSPQALQAVRRRIGLPAPPTTDG